MSRNSDTSSNHALEEEDEAFLDLEDPNNEILDDGDDREQVDDSEDEGAEGSAPTAESARADNGNANDADEADAPSGANVIDLNEVPDIEPEQDHSIATFTAKDRKPLHVVRVSPKDASIIAAAGESDEIYILKFDSEGKTLNCIATLEGHTDTIAKLSFSPNGETLASGSLDTTVKLWDCNTWTLLHTFQDLSGEIETLLWHPSSLALVAGASDAQAALWNVKKGTLAMYFVGHRQGVTSALWTPDTKKLVTASSDGTLVIFNPKTGEQETTIAKDLSPDAAGVSAITFLSDDVVLVGCDDGTIHLVSISKAKVVAHAPEIHEQCIESMSVNSNKTLYLTAACDCKVVVWNAQDHSARVAIDVGESVIPASWAGPYVLAGCSDGSLRVWDGRSSAQQPIFVATGHKRMILDFAVDESSRNVFTASDDGTVKVFSLPSS